MSLLDSTVDTRLASFHTHHHKKLHTKSIPDSDVTEKQSTLDEHRGWVAQWLLSLGIHKLLCQPKKLSVSSHSDLRYRSSLSAAVVADK